MNYKAIKEQNDDDDVVSVRQRYSLVLQLAQAKVLLSVAQAEANVTLTKVQKGTF